MNDSKKTFVSYVLGFAFSVALTLAAYVLVTMHWASHGATFSQEFLIAAIIALAMAQLTVQLVFFLHLGKESKQRWNVVIFAGTFILVLVVVVGSLWIMNHLNYNMMLMTPEQIDSYMLGQG